MNAREICIRNLTSSDWLRRDCVVTEEMHQAGYMTKVIRRCTYHVESQATLPSLTDSATWATHLDPLPPRQVFVTKDLDPQTGDEQICYKVLGHLYVVWDHAVFCIGYRHILSMAIAPIATTDL